jgi:hypothetical protein
MWVNLPSVANAKRFGVSRYGLSTIIACFEAKFVDKNLS